MSNNTTEEKPQSKNPLELKAVLNTNFSRFVTETGKILPRRITRLTAKQQRHLTKEIKRARNLLLAQ